MSGWRHRKQVHTGRSRNDQIALDMKLYVRDEIVELKSLVRHLMQTLHALMKKHLSTYMPGFTAFAKSLSQSRWQHHLGAYMEMFKRDYAAFATSTTG